MGSLFAGNYPASCGPSIHFVRHRHCLMSRKVGRGACVELLSAAAMLVEVVGHDIWGAGLCVRALDSQGFGIVDMV